MTAADVVGRPDRDCSAPECLTPSRPEAAHHNDFWSARRRRRRQGGAPRADVGARSPDQLQLRTRTRRSSGDRRARRHGLSLRSATLSRRVHGREHLLRALGVFDHLLVVGRVDQATDHSSGSVLGAAGQASPSRLVVDVGRRGDLRKGVRGPGRVLRSSPRLAVHSLLRRQLALHRRREAATSPRPANHLRSFRCGPWPSKSSSTSCGRRWPC